MLFIRKQPKKEPASPEEEELRALLGPKLGRLGAVVSPPGRLRPAQMVRELETLDAPRLRRRPWWKGAAVAALLCLAVTAALVLPALRAHAPGADVAKASVANKSAQAAKPAGDGSVKAAVSYGSLVAVFQKMYDDGLTTSVSMKTAGGAMLATQQAETTAAPMNKSADTAAAGDVSQTNLQVAGVDEGDILKNDGSYLYTITNNTVRIVDVRAPKNIALAATLRFDDTLTPAELYVNGSRLAVVLRGYKSENAASSGSAAAQGSGAVRSDIAYTGVPQTRLRVYDLADHKNPRLVRDFVQDGNFLSSRLVKDTVYVASVDGVQMESRNTIASALVPSVGSGKSARLLTPAELYLPKNPQSSSWAVLSGVDIKNDSTKTSTAACVGAGQSVYCSGGNFYIACQQYGYTVTKASGVNMAQFTGTNNKTELLRFALADGKVTFTGSFSVNGALLNQFSMDETGGIFRVATTSRSTEKPQNNVYLYDGDLKLTGSLENLAPGETMHSVRFMGSRAYLVTFRTVDPLFALDLSNPKAPRVLGQLKIPGFSDYLQPWSDTLLIGFGKDTVESGNMAYYKGLKLSLFDVSDPLNPKELYSYKIGDRGSSSQVLNDHRALLFSRERNIIGIPVTVMQLPAGAQNNAQAYGEFKYDGYYVLGLDMNKGFYLRGSVTHMAGGQTQNDLYAQGLSVLRGAYAGNVLYTVSNAKVIANSLTDFSQLSSLKLTETNSAGAVPGSTEPGYAVSGAAGNVVGGSTGAAQPTK